MPRAVIVGAKRTAEELIEYYVDLCGRFPIISIEDGCAENDWDGWKKLTAKLGGKIQLVGDDLFVTNVEFLRKGIAEKVANSILVKVNQIGSLTETIECTCREASSSACRRTICSSSESNLSARVDIAASMRPKETGGSWPQCT